MDDLRRRKRDSGSSLFGRLHPQSSSASQRAGNQPGPSNFEPTLLDLSPEDAWDRKLVLALDGGGIKGLSSLIIVTFLMDRIGELEFPGNKVPGSTYLRPCHYFDHIFGTSTGGLNALLLGRLRMTVAEAVTAFKTAAKSVFGHPRKRHCLRKNPFQWSKQFKHSPIHLESAVQMISNSVLGTGKGASSLDFLPDTRENICKTTLVTYRDLRNLSDGKRNRNITAETYLLRSYVHSWHAKNAPSVIGFRYNAHGEAENIHIWQAARATSAAPAYFDAMVLNGFRHLDGAMEHNNPSKLAYKEVRQMVETEFFRQDSDYGSLSKSTRASHVKPDRVIGALVSIGTGYSKEQLFPSETSASYFLHAFHMGKFLLKSSLDSERTHEDIRDRLSDAQVPYFRLNTMRGLEKVDLDELKPLGPEVGRGEATFSLIEDATTAWLESNGVEEDGNRISHDGRRSVKEYVDELAGQLIAFKRAREQQDPKRWSEFISSPAKAPAFLTTKSKTMTAGTLSTSREARPNIIKSKTVPPELLKRAPVKGDARRSSALPKDLMSSTPKGKGKAERVEDQRPAPSVSSLSNTSPSSSTAITSSPPEDAIGHQQRSESSLSREPLLNCTTHDDSSSDSGSDNTVQQAVPDTARQIAKNVEPLGSVDVSDTVYTLNNDTSPLRTNGTLLSTFTPHGEANRTAETVPLAHRRSTS